MLADSLSLLNHGLLSFDYDGLCLDNTLLRFTILQIRTSLVTAN